MRAIFSGATDVAALSALHAAAFPDAAWSPDSISASLSAGAIGYLAAHHAAAPPAAMALSRIAADEVELLAIGVSPDARRRGLAGALLAAIATDARAAGAAALILDVAADNASARRLYDRAGFRQTGGRPFYYRRPLGGSVDALILRLGFF